METVLPDHSQPSGDSVSSPTPLPTDAFAVATPSPTPNASEFQTETTTQTPLSDHRLEPTTQISPASLRHAESFVDTPPSDANPSANPIKISIGRVVIEWEDEKSEQDRPSLPKGINIYKGVR